MPAFKYLAAERPESNWVISVCRARQSTGRGQPYGRPRKAAVRAAERLTQACPSPAPTGRVRRSFRRVDSQAGGCCRGQSDLVAVTTGRVVLVPWRYTTGKAVSRDRATLTAFTTLEASEFCGQAGSKDGRSCDGLDGCARSWPLRRHCSSAPLPR